MIITHEMEMAEYCHRVVEFRDGKILSDTRKGQSC
jgi:ABC-type lipoprotein export system ATPase subunit